VTVDAGSDLLGPLGLERPAELVELGGEPLELALYA
jgi:hypothetical protein